MEKRHCAGCGRSERTDAQPQEIERVTVRIGKAGRSFDPVEEYGEDLCPDCQKELLVQFFAVDPLVIAPLSPPASLRAAS